MLRACLPAAVWKQHKDIVKGLRKANVDRQVKTEKKGIIYVEVIETELLTSRGSGENVTLPCVRE